MDLLDRAPELLRKQLEQRRVVRVALRAVVRRGGLVQRLGGLPEDGLQLVLLVELEGLVGGAVQMDRQVRHTEQRAPDMHQVRHEPARVAGAHNDAAGEAQVPVEPGVPEPATVRLDAALQVPLLGALGDRAHTQVGRVGVPADDVHAVARLKPAADRERHERRLVPREAGVSERIRAAYALVLAAAVHAAVPRLALVELGEPGLFQDRGARRGRVKRRGARLDVLDKAQRSARDCGTSGKLHRRLR